jgi:hypothetical protein
MDEFERAQQREADMELVRREMGRKSRDLIRVFNPLKQPFRFKWDSYPQVVPAEGYKDIERYLAQHYLKKISQHLIGLQAREKGEELMKLRQKQFGKTFLDKYEENKEVWDRVPRTNDPQLIEAIAEQVIIGLVEEYGMEDIEDFEKPIEKRETPYDTAFKLMDRRVIDGEPMRPLKEENA